MALNLAQMLAKSTIINQPTILSTMASYAGGTANYTTPPHNNFYLKYTIVLLKCDKTQTH
jgi:hypothetical protein